MLRRAPTSITLTPEDVAAYEDRQRNRQLQENINPATGVSAQFSTPKKGVEGKVDPNDELKPLPGDRARVRSGVGREERILGVGR